jgi:hypothetical protein
MFRRWRSRRDCFHHDRNTGTSWITGHIIDAGARKEWHCNSCGRFWIK